MNWIFEAYSNVYNSAMMQGENRRSYAAPAKNKAGNAAFSLRKLFTR